MATMGTVIRAARSAKTGAGKPYNRYKAIATASESVNVKTPHLGQRASAVQLHIARNEAQVEA